MIHPLHDRVVALMRRVGVEIMMPRFRALGIDEIAEKAPGDVVTIVDRESEALLEAELAALLPGSHVVGEEACAADPAVLDGIGRGAVWIVDPLDGTANFAAGREPFAIMIALAEAGEVEAGWILDPVSGRLAHAVRGQGAFIDGARVAARETGHAPPLAALATRFLPEALRAKVRDAAAGRLLEVDAPGCAGEQYPRIGLGENDVALFWRALPWDHAPGALWLNEAGGKLARLDGRRYRVDDRGEGLLAAATPALWDEARGVLAAALAQ